MKITICGEVLTNEFGCPDDTEITVGQYVEMLDTFDVPEPQREALNRKIEQFQDAYPEVSLLLGNSNLPIGYISVCFEQPNAAWGPSRYLMGIAPDGSVAS